MLHRLLSNNYMRASLVLFIDVITSTVATSLVFLLFILFNIQTLPTRIIAIWIACSAIASAITFYSTKIYRSIIRYSTLHEIVQICMAVAFKEILLAILAGWCIAAGHFPSARFASAFILSDFCFTIAAMLLVRVAMLVIYKIIATKANHDGAIDRVLVYGIDDKAAAIPTRLSHSSHYQVVGFIHHDTKDSHKLLRGLPICSFASLRDIQKLKESLKIDGILFARHADIKIEQERLIDLCQEANLKLFIAPPIDEITDGSHFGAGIRKIKIQDLLGRDEIKISMDEIKHSLQGKVVMVTGAAGSIGSELCRQLAHLGVAKLIMFDNAETPLHTVRLEFEDNFPWLDFIPVIGDVRSPERLDFVFRKFKPQVVFHAAAYKHVPLMEENPCEAVLVNVTGSRNVADKCVEYDVEKMVMVSTDKAVNPTNIMGCTKRLAEIYVQSLGLAIEQGKHPGKTRFITTRFGNVLGSNGSVIPRFTEQIEKGGPVTVTDPEIRRFFMTIPEACRLVMEAATIATGTQIFVFDMGTPIKIADLAKRMIHLAGYRPDTDIKIEYTGLRPGEKLYEEVLATKENTIPTTHERIYVAKVRDYSHDAATLTTDKLHQFARNVDIPDMVILMKKTVPEFKSKHSIFEKYDIKELQDA